MKYIYSCFPPLQLLQDTSSLSTHLMFISPLKKKSNKNFAKRKHHYPEQTCTIPQKQRNETKAWKQVLEEPIFILIESNRKVGAT